MAHTTQTQTATSTRTAVAVALAVVAATVVGTTVGFTQWSNSNKAGLSVDDLDPITGITDDMVVLRGSGSAGSDYGLATANAGDTNGDGYDDLVVADADSGNVFAYFGGETTISSEPDWTVTADDSSEDFGFSVAGAGDVNGDSYADLLIGARSKGDDAQGAAMLYYGSASGPTSGEPDWEAVGSDDYQYFGQTVAGIGDVNGDDLSDIAVFTGGQETSGSLVSVYYGNTSGLTTEANWTYTMGEPYTQRSVNLAYADVNGDSYGDLLVGNPSLELRGYGLVNVFHGSSTGLPRRPSFTVSAGTNSDFGGLVGNAGDVNSDGYDDVIVGAPSYSNGQDTEGIAHVYYGSSTGLTRFAHWKAEVNLENAWLGIAATGLGDTNGDGFSDIAVTAPGYDADGDGSEGRVYLYAGSATGMSRLPLGISGAEIYDGMDVYGTAVVASGSFVGTSSTDIVISVLNYDEAEADGPAVLVYPNISL